MKVDIEWGNNVGEESRKTWKQKLENGFFDKYMSGNGLDIGGTGYLSNIHAILPTATIIDLGYPGYDGNTLPFSDCTQDYAYSSHCLEHIHNYKQAIREWHRVVKVGGHIIIAVPHQWLYEKKECLPSRYNEDHKRFYTAASFLREIEESLAPNTFRVKSLVENDSGYDYNQPDDQHSIGGYEIEVVLEKLK